MKSPILNGTIDSVLTVHNSSRVSQTTTFDVELVRRIFRGSLASRVVSPSDYKSTTIKTQSYERVRSRRLDSRYTYNLCAADD